MCDMMALVGWQEGCLDGISAAQHLVLALLLGVPGTAGFPADLW